MTYALPEDTDTAAAELRHASVRGQQLNVSISNRKQKQSRRSGDAPGEVRPHQRQTQLGRSGDASEHTAARHQLSVSNGQQKQGRHGGDASEHTAGAQKQKSVKRPAAKKQKIDSGAASEVLSESSPPKKRKIALKDANVAGNSKKGRLIVRNLSFKVSSTRAEQWCHQICPKVAN